MIKPNLRTERMDGMGPDSGLNIIEGLDDLCKKYGVDKTFNVLELGSNNGVSTSLFAHYAGVVHAVDIVRTEKMNNVLNDYDNIIFHHESVSDAIPKFKDEFFDLIYIDADHSYAGVMNDLRSSYPKLKQNKIMSGHDYLPNSPTLFTVFEAVNDFFKSKYSNFKEELQIFSDSSWAIIKR